MISIMIATSISFIIVVIENYVLHYSWTFDSSRSHRSAFPRFMLMSMTGFILNWLVVYVGVEKLSFNYLLVQAFSIFIVVVWNLVISTFFIFPSNKIETET